MQLLTFCLNFYNLCFQGVKPSIIEVNRQGISNTSPLKHKKIKKPKRNTEKKYKKRNENNNSE